MGWISGRRLIGAALCVVVAGALLTAGWWRMGPALVKHPSMPAATVGDAAPQRPGDAGAPVVPPATAPPTSLAIPAASVHAPIEAVGIDAQGRMAAPSGPEKVGWYSLGPSPGQAGSAVLDGHLDWWTGPAVFAGIDHLRTGDRLSVTRADGSTVTFAVTSSARYPYDSPPPDLFATSGTPSLALITCAGVWDRQHQNYLERLVVRATYAPTQPSEPPPEAN